MGKRSQAKERWPKRPRSPHVVSTPAQDQFEMSQPAGQWIDLKDAARELGIKPSTLRGWLHDHPEYPRIYRRARHRQRWRRVSRLWYDEIMRNLKLREG
jgi:hypothetical protein